MRAPVIDNFLLLFQAMCVIVLAAYLVTRSQCFIRQISGGSTRRDAILLALFFGAMSIYGSLIGVGISGAFLNIRDLGPALGGLICGPAVGLAAGAIGGSFRYAEGGFTALPCSLAPLIAGLLGGLISRYRGGFPGIAISAAFSGSMELLHMLLVLALARPYDQALEVVSEAIGPMLPANVLGTVLFTFIISNFIKERQTETERDSYRLELERKQAEIALAAEIQKSFLPQSVPSIPGFEIAASSMPALEVGGDFYDFIPREGKTLGLVIADVAGKSFPAALFMALSRTIVRTSALNHNDMASIVSSANGIITSESSSGMFVTLFLGILHGDTGVFRFINAGHNPPLVYRAGSHSFDSLGATGIALGILEDAQFEERQTSLGPGDILVMYTDGIVEAMSIKGTMFGSERLRSAIARSSELPAGDLLNNIVEETLRFSAGMPQSDDITALVVKAR